MNISIKSPTGSPKDVSVAIDGIPLAGVREVLTRLDAEDGAYVTMKYIRPPMHCDLEIPPDKLIIQLGGKTYLLQKEVDEGPQTKMFGRIDHAGNYSPPSDPSKGEPG